MSRFKGTKGYVSFLKKYDFIFVAVSALICFIVYYLGIRIWGSKANIGTVVAICSLLPGCKRLANLIVIFPFKGISDENYDRIEKKVKNGWFCMTDMLFATEKCNCMFDHLVMTDTKLFAFSSMSKDKNDFAKQYLEEAFRKRQLGIKVNLYSGIDEYLAVLDKTAEEEFTNEKAMDYVTSLLI